jgi:hypothetical protein
VSDTYEPEVVSARSLREIAETVGEIAGTVADIRDVLTDVSGATDAGLLAQHPTAPSVVRVSVVDRDSGLSASISFDVGRPLRATQMAALFEAIEVLVKGGAA